MYTSFTLDFDWNSRHIEIGVTHQDNQNYYGTPYEVTKDGIKRLNIEETKIFFDEFKDRLISHCDAAIQGHYDYLEGLTDNCE
jgi:hypothetical protein